MCIKKISLCLMALATFMQYGCTNYSKEVSKALEKAYGYDLAGYYFKGTPVSNFGVGTVYDKQISSYERFFGPSQPTINWLLVDPEIMYLDSISISEQSKLNNLIFRTGAIGSTVLNEKITTKLNLSMIFPDFYELLQIDPSIDIEKGVKTTLKATQVINRQLSWPELNDAASKGKLKDYVRKSINSNDIIIASKDLVLDGFTVEIEVDAKANPKLDLKLNEKIGNVLGSNTSLSVDVNKKTQGKYEITSNKPVIAAVLFVRPPKSKVPAGMLAALMPLKVGAPKPIDKLESWEPIDFSNADFDPLEKFFLENKSGY